MRRLVNYSFIFILFNLFISVAFADNLNPFMVDTSVVVVNSTDLVDHLNPSIASCDNNMFMVWEKESSFGTHEIRGSRVYPDGSIINRYGNIISDSGTVPSICYFKNRYIVSYYRNSSAFVRIIDTLGNVLSSETQVENIYGAYYPVSMASIGNKILLAYENSNQLSINLLKVDTFNNILSYQYIYTGEYTSGFKVTSSNGKFFISYLSGGIKALIVDTSGVMVDSNMVIAPANNSPSDNSEFSLTRGENYFFVSWVGSDENIYGERIDTNGNIIDSSGFKITAYPGLKEYPSVDFDGTNFLVTYSVNDYYKVRKGTRVSLDGSIIDLSGFHITYTLGEQYNLIYNGQNYFQIWQDSTHLITNDSISYYGRQIAAVRILSNSSVLDDTDQYLTGSDSTSFTVKPEQKTPSVAYGNGRYLIVWSDSRDNQLNQGQNIYGEFMDTLENRSNVFPICTYSGDQRSPKVYYDHNKYFITWCDYRDGANERKIYGTIVDDVLSPDSSNILFYPSGKLIQSIDFDGSFLVLFDYAVKAINNYFIFSVNATYSENIGPDYGLIQYVVEYDDSFNAIKSHNFGHLIPWGALYYNDNIIIYNNMIYFIYSYHDANTNVIRVKRLNENFDIIDTLNISINPNPGELRRNLKSSLYNKTLLLTWGDNSSTYSEIFGTFYDMDNTSDSINKTSFLISDINGNNKNHVLTNVNNKYITFWENDIQNGIVGTSIDTNGVIDSIIHYSSEESYSPDFTYSDSNSAIIVYSKLTDSYNGQTINKMRIWGVLDSFLNGIDTTITDTTIIDTTKTINLMSRPFPDYVFAHCNNLIIFKYYLSSKINVHLSVFNIAGIKIFGYDNYSDQNTGINQISVNSSRLPNGIYFYKFKAGTTSKSGKIIILH